MDGEDLTMPCLAWFNFKKIITEEEIQIFEIKFNYLFKKVKLFYYLKDFIIR
jgi:hypothetical protein